MGTECDIKWDIFDIREERSDWELSTRIDCDNNLEIIKDSKSNITTIIIE